MSKHTPGPWTIPELLGALKEALAELYLIHSKYGDREHARDCSYAIRHGEEIINKVEGKV